MRSIWIYAIYRRDLDIRFYDHVQKGLAKLIWMYGRDCIKSCIVGQITNKENVNLKINP